MQKVRQEVLDFYRYRERYDWVTQPKYPEKIFHNLRAHAVIKELNKYLTPKSFVLDMGCGTGFISRLIGECNLTVVDINAWALSKVKEHVSRDFTAIESDISNIPLKSNSVDICICSEVLEHILYPEEVLLEVKRLLKPSGIFIGSVPTTHFLWSVREHLSRSHPCKEPFHNNYKKKDIKYLLSKHFTIIKLTKCGLGLSHLFVCKLKQKDKLALIEWKSEMRTYMEKSYMAYSYTDDKNNVIRVYNVSDVLSNMQDGWVYSLYPSKDCFGNAVGGEKLWDPSILWIGFESKLENAMEKALDLLDYLESNKVNIEEYSKPLLRFRRY